MRGGWVVLLGVVAALPSPAAAANAVLNPDFDVDKSNWSEANPLASTPGAVFARDTDSGSGTPLGAADLSYSRPASATTGDFDIWTNCMTVGANAPLVFGGQMSFVVNPAGSSSQIVLFVYDTVDCTGPFSFNQAAAGTTVAGTVDGSAATYTRFAGAITTGGSAQTMQMFLEINPGATDTPTRALFDRIYVGPPGTSPVELLSFGVE